MGKNGAGKSTLLKLICGIITPTSGTIIRDGKIVPLLELGAGFHPELTAKENILINGLMLGLSKKEIESKYYEILDFAELSHVANEPLRTFSSGMYIRLAFSVAININPDIVILDEIMGVGDQSFQKKSSKKILEFQQKGKTLIIVSHDPALVERICDQAMLIDKGKIVEIGDPSSVAKAYTAMSS
jgi:ABC-type polysaccharide/polyol phosphate transport system ATPase subunit